MPMRSLGSRRSRPPRRAAPAVGAHGPIVVAAAEPAATPTNPRRLSPRCCLITCSPPIFGERAAEAALSQWCALAQARSVLLDAVVAIPTSAGASPRRPDRELLRLRVQTPELEGATGFPAGVLEEVQPLR